jgi:hypothetical protein
VFRAAAPINEEEDIPKEGRLHFDVLAKVFNCRELQSKRNVCVIS